MRAWMGFLHPTQARLVKRTFNGPARVRGPAGTGKTVLLLHRAAWLAAVRPGRILVTSFVSNLPPARRRLPRRCPPTPPTASTSSPSTPSPARSSPATRQPVRVNQRAIDRAYDRAWLPQAADTPLARPASDARYWRDEIDHVIKGRGLRELAEYEAIDRGGRTVPLTNTLRNTPSGACCRPTRTSSTGRHLRRQRPARPPPSTPSPDNRPDPGWSAVLIDEVQDLNLLGPRLCRELAGERHRHPVPRRRRPTSPLPWRFHPRRRRHLRHRPRRRAAHQLPQHPPDPRRRPPARRRPRLHRPRHHTRTRPPATSKPSATAHPSASSTPATTAASSTPRQSYATTPPTASDRGDMAILCHTRATSTHHDRT